MRAFGGELGVDRKPRGVTPSKPALLFREEHSHQQSAKESGARGWLWFQVGEEATQKQVKSLLQGEPPRPRLRGESQKERRTGSQAPSGNVQCPGEGTEKPAKASEGGGNAFAAMARTTSKA